MKKIFLVLLLVFAFVFPLFSTSERGGEASLSDLSFTVAPLTPLFKENDANIHANNFRIQFLVSPKKDDYVVDTILVSRKKADGNPEYVPLKFRYDRTKEQTSFYRLKAGMNLALLRFEIKNVFAIEGFMHATINTIFEGYGGVDVLGFDGQYGGGFALSFLDTLIIRCGIHHFSGHWGDEILSSFDSRYTQGVDYEMTTEYTRNNSYLFDVEIKLFKSAPHTLTFGFEFENPIKKSWIRPAAHVPPETIKPTSEESPELWENMSKYGWDQEGFIRDNSSYPLSYGAYRIGLFLEYEYKIKDFSRLYAALDVELHQDGMIDLSTCTYDPARHWEVEFTSCIGIAFFKTKNSSEFNIEIQYHHGRFPLLNFFYQKSQYVSIGFGATI